MHSRNFKRVKILEEDIDEEVNYVKNSKKVNEDQIPTSDSIKNEKSRREIIASQIFEEYSTSDHENERDNLKEKPQNNERRNIFNVEDGEEEEDEDNEDSYDNFIVDEIHSPKNKVNKKNINPALYEAESIFGTGFDFDELQNDFFDGEIDQTKNYKKSDRKTKVRDKFNQLIDPNELEALYLTELDEEIRLTDIPERLQIRGFTEEQSQSITVQQLETEAIWIYSNYFQSHNLKFIKEKKHENIDKNEFILAIKEVLILLKKQLLEIPFIAAYREDIYSKSMNINDLWLIYDADFNWDYILKRKASILKNFYDILTTDALINDLSNIKVPNLKKMIEDCQTIEELNDYADNFLLHNYDRLLKMEVSLKGSNVCFKSNPRGRFYQICIENCIDKVVQTFGLTTSELGENLSSGYALNTPKTSDKLPNEIADAFINELFPTDELVLSAAIKFWAIEIYREPSIRQFFRKEVKLKAKYYCKPTKRGLKEIDEHSPYFEFKYIKAKPINTITPKQLLLINKAKNEGLIDATLQVDDKNGDDLVSELSDFFSIDEYRNTSMEWNKIRYKSIQYSVTKLLLPELYINLHFKLLNEASQYVSQFCSQKIRNIISNSIKRNRNMDKIMAFYLDDSIEAKKEKITGGIVIMDANCNVIDFSTNVCSIHELLNKKNENPSKENLDIDKKKFINFLKNYKIKYVIVPLINYNYIKLIDKLREWINSSDLNFDTPNIVHMESHPILQIVKNKSIMQQYENITPFLHYSIAAARWFINPLHEICFMLNDKLLFNNLNLHICQKELPEDFLLNQMERVMCEIITQNGYLLDDLSNDFKNKTILKYIAGLGPRKASQIIKIIKSKGKCLVNRSELVTLCGLGPNVFVNCSASIILQNDNDYSDEVEFNPLDSTTIHPESYERARKMLVDALECDEDEDNPKSHLELINDIKEHPESLNDLDLDAFAEELKKRGFGEKIHELTHIRSELIKLFSSDINNDFFTPLIMDPFDLVFMGNTYLPSCPTSESILNNSDDEEYKLVEGKIINCTVIGFTFKQIPSQQADPPFEDPTTGIWTCGVCKTVRFQNISEAWKHNESGECIGKAIGVKTRLDCGIQGFIFVKLLSDNPPNDPRDRVEVGMSVIARVLKLKKEKYQIDLSTKSSDLLNTHNSFKSFKDEFYDYVAEEIDHEKLEAKKNDLESASIYIKRVIFHPSFFNIGPTDAEKMLSEMTNGDCIIRPSSKGTDRLVVTWRVYENIYKHIDILENDKPNAFSLGKTLIIGHWKFDDLDELIARFVQPMNSKLQQICSHKNFTVLPNNAEDTKSITEYLQSERTKNPTKISYLLSVSHKYSGRFILACLPRNQIRLEYISIEPDGFKLRHLIHKTLDVLLAWYKQHFRDPLPNNQQYINRKSIEMTNEIAHKKSSSSHIISQNNINRKSRFSSSQTNKSAHNSQELWDGTLEKNVPQFVRSPMNIRNQNTTRVHNNNRTNYRKEDSHNFTKSNLIITADSEECWDQQKDYYKHTDHKRSMSIVNRDHPEHFNKDFSRQSSSHFDKSMSSNKRHESRRFSNNDDSDNTRNNMQQNFNSTNKNSKNDSKTNYINIKVVDEHQQEELW